MKHYLTIIFLAGGALILAAQTNDMTNAVTGATNITPDIVTNITTNATAQIAAITPTNSTSAMTKTNHPAVSRPQRVKMTIHSEGPYQMDLNGHWATYQDHVRVTEGQMVMTCEWLLANLPEHGEHITNIVAMTNVVGDFVDNKNRKWHVTGDKGVYAYHAENGVTNETVTLTGNPPEIQEGEDTNTMTGDAIIYDAVTKKVNIKNPTSVYWYETNSPAGTNSFAPKI
jgi:lipopolysaccharide export system protein LptA